MQHTPRVTPIRRERSKSPNGALYMIFRQEKSGIVFISHVKRKRPRSGRGPWQLEGAVEGPGHRPETLGHPPGFPRQRSMKPHRSATTATVHSRPTKYHRIRQNVAIFVESQCTNSTLSLLFYFRVANIDPTPIVQGKCCTKVGVTVKRKVRKSAIGISDLLVCRCHFTYFVDLSRDKC
jgi:hypothetical protein